MREIEVLEDISNHAVHENLNHFSCMNQGKHHTTDPEMGMERRESTAKQSPDDADAVPTNEPNPLNVRTYSLQDISNMLVLLSVRLQELICKCDPRGLLLFRRTSSRPRSEIFRPSSVAHTSFLS